MKKKAILRWIALVMLLAAVIFVITALNNPQWGTVLNIGGLRIGASFWRVCYALYLAAMCGVFGASFLVKES